MRITSRYDAKCRGCGAAIAAGSPCEWNQGQGVRCVGCSRKKPAPPSTVTAYLTAPEPEADLEALARVWGIVKRITTPRDDAQHRIPWPEPMRGTWECRWHRGAVRKAGTPCVFCERGYPAFKEPTPRKRVRAAPEDLFSGGVA